MENMGEVQTFKGSRVQRFKGLPVGKFNVANFKRNEAQKEKVQWKNL
jgi:hypothetical protein